jgi:hypothetical protein
VVLHAPLPARSALPPWGGGVRRGTGEGKSERGGTRRVRLVREEGRDLFG